MKIYLVRHGIAHSKSDDPERSLTEEGKDEVIKVASFIIKEKKFELDKIFQSGKTRAKETAELIAQFIQPIEGIYESEELAPMTDPSKWLEKIKKMNNDTMLVGHLPHLNRLASLLLTKNENEIIQFSTAAIVCLSREEEGFTIDWIISPDIC